MAKFVPAADFDGIMNRVARPGLKEVAEMVRGKVGEVMRDDTGYFKNTLFTNVVDDEVIVGSPDIAAHIHEWGSLNQAPRKPFAIGASEIGRFDPQ